MVKALKGEDTAALPPATNPATTAVMALLALAAGGMNPTRAVHSNMMNIPAAAASVVAVAAAAARGGTADNSTSGVRVGPVAWGCIFWQTDERRCIHADDAGKKDWRLADMDEYHTKQTGCGPPHRQAHSKHLGCDYQQPNKNIMCHSPEPDVS